ncbi:FAD-dependent oxidoreductase [Candidatus Woesearchaeota archaeon]|nr:FAD-dependent oxidoreductase [Candidatus Woesearchaeota archaeon]
MYDAIIIGAGPAGLTAALYAGRYKMNVLVLGSLLGGVATEAHIVENYPGVKSIKGPKLMEVMIKQVTDLGVEIKNQNVTEIKKIDNGFEVFTDEGNYEAKLLLLAVGTKRKKLDLPDEDKYMGKGISYCVTCDAPLFKDKKVGVIGGRDSAVKAALHLSEYAEKVYIIYRQDKLRAEPTLAEQAEKNPKIEMVYNSNVVELKGNGFLEGVKLDTGVEMQLSGLIIEIGATPSIVIAKELGVAEDEQGYVIVDGKQKTNIQGAYAAGDITTASDKFKQIATAVGEGAVAAFEMYKELKNGEHH